MISVCWQAWKYIREESAVAENKGCPDGLKKQYLGYHNSWDCWYFTLLEWFWLLHYFDVGPAYWQQVEICCHIL
jgi:hypothetical protein